MSEARDPKLNERMQEYLLKDDVQVWRPWREGLPQGLQRTDLSSIRPGLKSPGPPFPLCCDPGLMADTRWWGYHAWRSSAGVVIGRECADHRPGLVFSKSVRGNVGKSKPGLSPTATFHAFFILSSAGTRLQFRPALHGPSRGYGENAREIER